MQKSYNEVLLLISMYNNRLGSDADEYFKKNKNKWSQKLKA